MKRASILFLLGLLAASIWLAGQEPRQLPGAIRVRVTEVPVDIIVLDRNNRPVLDLKQEDFVVKEDGIPQDIVHFSIESYVDTPKDGGPKPSQPRTEPPSEPTFENPHYRTFLLVMGRGRHRYFDAIPQLIHFLRTGLQPTDRVALMAYNRATDFTTDHEKLAGVLERYEKISPAIESKLNLRMQGLAAVYGSPNLLSKFQKDIDEIFGSPELGSRTLHSGEVPGAKERAADNRELMEAKQAVDKDQLAAQIGVEGAPRPLHVHEQVLTDLMLDGMSFDEYMAETAEGEMDKERLLAAIEYMRYMEGEKHLIFLNDQGFPMARLEHAQGLDAIASDARVRIHSIQTGGVFVGGEGSVYSASFGGFTDIRQMRNLRQFSGTLFNTFALQSVRNLSRLTGGQSFTYQDIGKSLQTLERTTEVSYLLGYIPKNKDLDGGFRRIDVQVKRPGLRVQHRRGYYAERVLKPYDRKQFLTYSRTAAAAGYEELIHDVDFSLKAEAVPRTAAAALHASLAIRPAPSLYTPHDDRYVGQLAISYFLFDPHGRLINETWDDLGMELKPETYNRVIKEGFPMERDIEAPADVNECLLRVVLYDVTNDRVGSAQAKLKLQDHRK